MPSRLLLLTTCGTSVLTNLTDNETRSWLTRCANQPELSVGDLPRLTKLSVHRKEELRQADDARRRELSAELNGIGAVMRRWAPHEVQHLLLHTDTALGREAVDVIASVLTPAPQFLTSAGLRTDSALNFKEALADLTRQLEEYWEWRTTGWQIVLNLTGGFKSINAYLQALGMLHADRCVFLFEGSDELMQIPRLPVRLAEADELRGFQLIFRKLRMGYRVNPAEVQGIPDSLLIVDDDLVSTSVWGDVVWQRVKGVLLGEQLLEPLSSKLAVLPGARKDFEKLPPARRRKVHEALDALSASLDEVRPLLKSETFKTIRNKLPSTHELYAWSDSGAGRIFGHYDQGRFLVDSIGDHL